MGQSILALDQGTTSSRAIVFGHEGNIQSQAQLEFPQILPAPGEVEHNPGDIWDSQLQTARQALAAASITGQDVAAIGVTNQRETTILWERDSGRPIANAIVWQSRVSATGWKRLFARKPAWSSMPISPRPKSPICSTRFPALDSVRNVVKCCSVPWMHTSCGA
jgi:glycerol kinase